MQSGTKKKKKKRGGTCAGTIKRHCGHRLDRALLKAFVPHKLFYFYFLHFNTNTSTYYSLYFQNGLSFNAFEEELSFLFFYFATLHASYPTSLANFNLSVHREGDWDGKNKRVSVWYLQTLQPSAWIFIFSQFLVVLGMLHQPKMSSFDVLRMRLSHQFILCNSLDKSYLFYLLGLIVFESH